MKIRSRLAALGAASVISLSALSPAAFAAIESVDETSGIAAHIGGNAAMTVMVYLCGSDLESRAGDATKDITDLLSGYTGTRDVNFIIQTGGASEWQKYGISAERSQRYKVVKGGLELIDDSLGQKDMGDPDTLSDFIKYCKTNYPAGSYALELWDHGGGTLYGFCQDENFFDDDGYHDSISLTEFDKALKAGGTNFKFVGFDTCLMSTVETAAIVSKYSPYLIASEETSYGWKYKNWVHQLCTDPYTDVPELAQTLIDDSIDFLNKNEGYVTNVDIIDTKAAVSEVIPVIDEFAVYGSKMLSKKKYPDIAKARVGSELDTPNYEMIDVIEFCDNIIDETTDTKDEAAVKKLREKMSAAVDKAVIYNRTTDDAKVTEYLSGLSMTHIHEDPWSLDDLTALHSKLGILKNYDNYLKSYCNIMAGGQIYSKGNKDLYKGCKWYSPNKAYSKKEYSKYFTNGKDIKFSIGDDGIPYFPLNYTKMRFCKDILLGMTVYDSEKEIMTYYGENGADCISGAINDYNDDIEDYSGYIDVGFDGKWLAVNGKILPVQHVATYTTDNELYNKVYIDCYYNGERARLYLAWDNIDSPYGDLLYWMPEGSDGKYSVKYLCNYGDVFDPIFLQYDFAADSFTNVTMDGMKTKITKKTRFTWENVDKLGSVGLYVFMEDYFGNESQSSSITYDNGVYTID